MKPPSRAPAIPKSIVTISPPGSRPGVNTFAIIPTTSPKAIHARIPMPSPSSIGRASASEETWTVYAFVLEQPPLPIESAAIACQLPVRADHPVARDDHGDRIGAVGCADSANGGWVADAFRELPIRD